MSLEREAASSFEWQNKEWKMHPARGLYWCDQDLLLVADSHFGKIKHFQKAGIPIPGEKEDRTYSRLEMMLQTFRPQKLVFLGDLFHSTYNTAWDQFIEWRKQFRDIEFHLVRGNHDILPISEYQRLDMVLHDQEWIIEDIALTHDPLQSKNETAQIGGHLHPGVHLKGKGKQRLRLPCFYFDSQKCILPALGHFTGLAKIEINKDASVFVTTGKRVMEI